MPPQVPPAPLPVRRPTAVGRIALALAALTLVVFLPACGFEFVEYDDRDYVIDNPHVRGGLTGENVVWAATAVHAANWHPLTWWSLQLDATLFGLDPAGFHFTNVALHTAAVVLLFLVLWRATGAVWPSAAAAAVFAVHPLRVESVAWVAQRKDVLSAVCWMLVLLAYVRYAARPSVGRYLPVAAAFAAGVLAKPTVITLPCVLLLFDYWPLGRLRRGAVGRLVLEKVPLFALAGGLAAATAGAQAGTAVRTLDQFPADVRLGNALIAYAQYLGAFVNPTGLAAFYPHPRLGVLSWQALAAAGLLAAATGLAVWQAGRRPYLLVGWLWFLGTLVPTIGLVQVGGQGRADRYTYLPLIGVTVALVWGVAELAAARPRWRRPLAVGGAAAVVVLAALAARQLDHWRDTAALWEHALAVTTDNYEAHRNLAAVRAQEGKTEEALAHFRRALDTYPEKRVVHTDIGALLMKQGRAGEAVAHFRAGVELAPDDPVARTNLGGLLLARGEPAEAADHLRAAAAAGPGYAPARFNLALALVALGRFDEAAAQLADGRALDPDNWQAVHWFANAVRDHGRPADAVPHYETVRRLRPAEAEPAYDLGVALLAAGRAEAAVGPLREAADRVPGSVKYLCGLGHALYACGRKAEAAARYAAAGRIDREWPLKWDQRAWLLAVHPDPRRRNGPLAVALAEQACQATEFTVPGFQDTLAAAYAEAGRFDDAVETARRAAAAADAARQADAAQGIRERLRLYEARQPFRGIVADR